MKIHEIVKNLREDKRVSQEYVAQQLNLSQSQYCRRENGEIKFVAQEISLLAKVLETTVAKLFGEETNSFTLHTQNGGNFGQYVQVPEKLIEQYEARIFEKDEMIKFLQEIISKFK